MLRLYTPHNALHTRFEHSTTNTTPIGTHHTHRTTGKHTWRAGKRADHRAVLPRNLACMIGRTVLWCAHTGHSSRRHLAQVGKTPYGVIAPRLACHRPHKREWASMSFYPVLSRCSANPFATRHYCVWSVSNYYCAHRTSRSASPTRRAWTLALSRR